MRSIPVRGSDVTVERAPWENCHNIENKGEKATRKRIKDERHGVSR